MALSNDPNWMRAGSWFSRNDSDPDIAIVGVGASKSALTPNQADTTPKAIRDSLLRYSTFNASKNVDVSILKAADFGDVSKPDNQEETSRELKTFINKTKTLIILGGDNSVTFSGVMAIGTNIGLITIDAHHDVRDGTSNGSPIRQLVDTGLPGKNIVQIGINDFANSKFYADRVKEFGISVIHRKVFEEICPEEIAKKALEKLGHCSTIYLDIDMDVCDRSVVPAAPAAMPGGISADQLRRLVAQIALDKRATVFDITEVDASIDAPDQRTTRLAALCILEIAGSKCLVS